MNVYQVITDRIIGMLEQGTVPWHKPWKGSACTPSNYISKRPYRGVNVWLLGCQTYTSPYWVTYNQAKKLGAQVRKGEKGTPIVFWKWLDKGEDSQGRKVRIPMLRYYTVFNIAQCEGIPVKVPEGVGDPTTPNDPIAQCEVLVSGYAGAPTISHGGDRACYKPVADAICMPERDTFKDSESYYATLFHEMTHSTGHKSRLDRPTLTDMVRFGDTNYSKEELCAEMGAAFLCGVAGIENAVIDNSAAYIASWLKRLRNDPKLVVEASAQAQKAVDHILGTTFAKEDDSE